MKDSIIFNKKKKEWHKPQLYSLDFNKTKAGNPGTGADFVTTGSSAS